MTMAEVENEHEDDNITSVEDDDRVVIAQDRICVVCYKIENKCDCKNSKPVFTNGIHCDGKLLLNIVL